MHRCVPVSLVLGVSTSPSALEAMLPLQAVAALRPHHFHLTPAVARAESLYSEARTSSLFVAPAWHTVAVLTPRILRRDKHANR